MGTAYKNKNRGYQQLRVSQDAVKSSRGLARTTSWRSRCSGASAKRRTWSDNQDPALRRSAATTRSSAGGCPQLGESLHAYKQAGQLAEAEFEQLNALGYKLENGLLRLVESLERKKVTGDRIDQLVVKQSNAAYAVPTLHHSITP